MKRMILIISIFALLSGISTSLILSPDILTQSQTKVELPDLTLKTLTNQKVNLKEDLDQKSILLFILPQSESCKQQLKALQELQQEYQASYYLYAVAIGNLSSNQLQQMKEELNLNFPIIIDRQAKLTDQLLVSAIPTLIFVNNRSQVVERHVGLLNLSDLKQNLKSITKIKKS